MPNRRCTDCGKPMPKATTSEPVCQSCRAIRRGGKPSKTWSGTKTGPCTIEGCIQIAYCRSLCRTHYSHAQGYGKKSWTCTACGGKYQGERRAKTDMCPPCARSTGQISRRITLGITYQGAHCKVYFTECSECHKVFTSQRLQSVCSEEACVKKANAQRSRKQYVRTHPRTCKDCGISISIGKHRCDDCLSVWKKKAARAQRRAERKRGSPSRTMTSHRKRARFFGVTYEHVNRLTVFVRDGWRCGICNKKINQRLAYPHPMSASIDHIVPMSEGGPHVVANLQAAHFICNCYKAAGAIGGDQLKLLG
jgi:HNH endonuclease